MAITFELERPPGPEIMIQLRRGEHTLKCKLRFIDAGRRVILYLADEPFHQLTYERQ